MRDDLAGLLGPSHEPNCGVTTVAVITGRPFAEVFEWMRVEGKHNRAWKGRTTHAERVAAMKHFGATLGDTARANRGCTLGVWVRRWARRGTTYMVDVTGHAMAYRDGVFYDQCGAKTLAEKGGARRRVRRFTEVTGVSA